MKATVIITSKNRRDDLRKAVQSAVDQTVNPEILVIDDGSTDGTADMIRTEFPHVKLHREEQSRGLIVQRNRGAELATGDVVFSIDDDATFSTPRIIEQTLLEFDHPRIGAVAMPFINVNKENFVMQRSPGETGIVVPHDYIGTAHAIDRKLFLQLDGYRPYLFHQGEEQDYCIRMLNHGKVVRLGRADPILHYESPRRDFRRMDLYGRRNDILFVWYNVPWPAFPIQLLGTTYRGVIFGFKVGRPLRMLHGLFNGYTAMLHEWHKRKPVSIKTFQLMRRLKRRPATLDQIEGELRIAD